MLVENLLEPRVSAHRIQPRIRDPSVMRLGETLSDLSCDTERLSFVSSAL